MRLWTPIVLAAAACASVPTPEVLSPLESRGELPTEAHVVALAPAAEGPEDDASRRPFEVHGVNVFTGYAWERAGGGFKIGLDYEYRFTDLFGVGAFVNYIAGDFNVVVVGLPSLYLHPWKELTLIASPGVEFESGGETEALLRLGGYYEFRLGGRWKLAPTAMVDIQDSKTVPIVGLNFVFDF